MKSRFSPGASRPLAAATLAIGLSAFPLMAQTYDVHLQPQKFTLYDDPYNGNQVELGGFSGLFPVPGKKDTFYAVTDRGPAPDFVNASGSAFKVWLVPEFGPHLVMVRVLPNGKAIVQHVTPLTRPDGAAITGLPTTKPATDVPFDTNLNPLPFDEDSLDAEGLTIDPWGNFWVCEEYKPSVAMLTPDGQVKLRLVPAGTEVGTEIVPTYPVLPGVLAKRRNNRGLEGITASSDGILYAIMQRPLNNPNRAAADANGNVRLVAIDLNSLNSGTPVVRQYLYRIPAVPNNVTLSDLFSTGPGRMLVAERATDKLYEINVAGATDITPLEDPITGRLLSNPSKTIEQLDPAGLAALGVVAVTKSVVIDSLTAIDPLLEKVEGICQVGDRIFLTYDNDFNVAETASIPDDPYPTGPLVQLEILGTNYPKIFSVPRP